MAQNFDGGKFDKSGLENFDESKIDECQCIYFIFISIIILTVCTCSVIDININHLHPFG